LPCLALGFISFVALDNKSKLIFYYDFSCSSEGLHHQMTSMENARYLTRSKTLAAAVQTRL